MAQNLYDMWRRTVEIGAAQIRCVTEIALKSPFLCVSSRHEKLSCTVWTATAQNWNKSFTHIEHGAGALGRGLIIGNLSTRRSWFTNGMAGSAGLDGGRGLCVKCKSLSKTTWNHHERRQNDSVENSFQRFALRFVSFLRRKHDFRRRISTFVWQKYSSNNPEFEPLVSTWKLALWSPWPQLKNVLTCAVAVMLQKYFRLASW